MNQPEDLDLIKSLEGLKMKINCCQTEHSHITKLACSLNSLKMNSASRTDEQFPACSGDATDINRNKSSSTISSSKLTHEEYLSKLVKNTSAENLKLRESNVKLKQKSKIQDIHIRELNRKIKQYERNLQQSRSQKASIYDLKDAIDKKNAEIVQLRKNINDVKLLLKKEQNKATFLQKKQAITTSKSDANREIESKVQTLLLQVDLLLKEQELKGHAVCLNSECYNVIQALTNNLVLCLDAFPNGLDSVDSDVSVISSSKSDKSVQVSAINDSSENANTGLQNESCFSVFRSIFNFERNTKSRHRKHTSV